MSLIRRSARDEEGSVLIAVVGIMVVLTVFAIGAYAMSSDNLLQSKRERGRAQALTVAEAGLEQVLWRLKVGQAPTGTVPIVVDVPEMGTCKVETVQNGTTWHVIATGSASSTPGITRTVSAYVLAMSIWDMFYADGPVNPGANGKFNGQGKFHGSMYMRGNWPRSAGQASFDGGPFFCKDGNIALGGSASIGANTPEGVDLFCNGTIDPNGIATNTRIHTNVPDLPMPQQSGPELSVARNEAISESADGVQGPYSAGGLTNDETRISGDSTGVPSPLAPPFADATKTYTSPSSRYYKLIDDDSIVNTSVTEFYIGESASGATLPSFGRPYDPSLGHSPDDFAWDASKQVLTVQGTVFIDAKDVYINNVKWAGKGTLVCSGNVHIGKGKWEPACFSVAPMVHAWDPVRRTYGDYDPEDENGYPKKNCVGVSASGYVEEASADAYGVFFSSMYFTVDPKMSSSKNDFHGEIVAPEITMNSHAEFWCTPGMGTAVPPSMPGGAGQIVAVSGWHEGRN